MNRNSVCLHSGVSTMPIMVASCKAFCRSLPLTTLTPNNWRAPVRLELPCKGC